MQMLTRDDLLRSGACLQGVQDWIYERKICVTALPVDVALQMAFEWDRTYILQAAQLDGYGFLCDSFGEDWGAGCCYGGSCNYGLASAAGYGGDGFGYGNHRAYGDPGAYGSGYSGNEYDSGDLEGYNAGYDKDRGDGSSDSYGLDTW